MGFGGWLYTARMECFEAAVDGNLDLLKQLRESGYSWDEATCTGAALNGHLETLQWARKNGCPWNETTCSDAAEHGHLEILQWARKNGCPWDEETCAFAALSGHLDVLQWASKNGCPWNKKTCAHAAWVGRLDILHWAIANGCDHDCMLPPRTRKVCVEGGIFPGHGCLVSGCSDDEKSEGLCDTHKAAVYSVLEILMCGDTAKLVLEIVCAPN